MVSSESRPIVRRQSTQHYQTFNTPPPKSRGRPISNHSDRSYSFGSQQADNNGNGNSNRNGAGDEITESGQNKLPKKQMAVLAFIALAEQTALNSLSPYLPDMTSRFPEVHGENVGVYVGLIASAFALAQFVTNYYWGWLSDRVGRKPVILLGTACTAVCFALFGFCTTLWQAITVQALMGILNGNAGLVSTCLGEITNRSNQSRAFTYLPVLYGIGGITGPLLGGSLVFKTSPWNNGQPNPYPYVVPNVISAVILILDFIVTFVLLEESLDDAENLPTIPDRLRQLFSWVWQFTTSHRPTYLRARSGPVYHQPGARRWRSFSDLTQDETDLDSASENEDDGDQPPKLAREEIFNRDTILLLLTYLIFALINVSFNSLYPIFAQAAEPAGRELTPQEIGLSLGFSGAVTILFQICIFGKLRDKMGNKWSYRACLLGFVISLLLMPLVGYKGSDENGRLSKESALLAVELCVVLLIKTVSAVGGLTSALLLVSHLFFTRSGSEYAANT